MKLPSAAESQPVAFDTDWGEVTPNVIVSSPVWSHRKY